MLKRIGFFHFVQNHDDPFGCLAESLNEKSAEYEERDISGSLMVLPEAFNLGKPYYPPQGAVNTPGDAKIPIDQALKDLRGQAAAHGIVLVAGLIDGPFSSAYWVGPDGPPELMCHKMGDDGSGNYRPWDGCDDENNPIQRFGACMGALICLDALLCEEETTAARTRRENLLREIKRCDQPHRIICISGRMSAHCMPQFDGLSCILANSSGQKSFVKNDLTEVAQVTDPKRNQICFADLL